MRNTSIIYHKFPGTKNTLISEIEWAPNELLLWFVIVDTRFDYFFCSLFSFQIVDGNAKTDVSNRREPGQFCGETEQPQVFISETSYVKIVFHTDNFTDQVSQEHLPHNNMILLSYGSILNYKKSSGLVPLDIIL